MPREKTRLYFLAGAQATPEEQAEADALKMTMFRNASLVTEGCCLEQADEVAGKVPAAYAKMRGCTVVTPKAEGGSSKK